MNRIFMTIPGPFPTIPDHNTVRPADSNDYFLNTNFRKFSVN